jgi:hypothetical protein
MGRMVGDHNKSGPKTWHFWMNLGT